MANKRDFKKSIEAIGASICDEMMMAYYNIEGVDRPAVSEAIEKVLKAITMAKNNANIYFDRGPKGYANKAEYIKEKDQFFKALFEKISAVFSTEIDSALKQFNAAIPAQVKNQNKELAN